MKNLWSLIAFVALLAYSLPTFAQTENTFVYTAKGTVKGLDSGMIYRLATDLKPIDSAAILNGRFTLTGKMDMPGREFFMLKPGNWSFQAFIDAKDITLDIDTTGAQHQNDNGTDLPIIWQISQKGSPMADVYNAYLKEGGIAEFLELSRKMRLATKDSIAYMNHRMDSLRNVLPQRIKNWTESYIAKNPSSLGSIYVFSDYYREVGEKSASYLGSILQQFTGAAKESVYYKRLQHELTQLQKVDTGKPAPNFALLKRNKQSFKLSSTRGSVVLLDFWASWCKPCRANIPALKKLYAKYHSKGFEMIGISADRERASWIKALDVEKMPWPQVIDDKSGKTSKLPVTELYSVNRFPTYVLISKKGEIVLSSSDEEMIEKKIDELLN